MNLGELIARAVFGRDTMPAAIHVGLANRGKELGDSGYKRGAIRKGEWRLSGASASADLMFGPFANPVTFDEIVLYVDGAPIERMGLPSPMGLPAGVTYEHAVEVRCG